jgi:predicted metalloendopeptidase
VNRFYPRYGSLQDQPGDKMYLAPKERVIIW